MTRYANRTDPGDIHPCEITEHLSGDELLVRDMIADRDPDWKMVKVMDRCLNNDDQMVRDPPVWTILPDRRAVEFIIRLGKDGTWRDKYGHRYILSDTPVKFHDFNIRTAGLDG